MNVKKFLVAMLMIALSTLLVNQVSALTITVFAPSAYPYIDLIPGFWVSNGNAPLPDINGYVPNQFAPANPAFAGWALTWESTPWQQFIGPNQQGSVHADTWLRYVITGLAGVRVYLFHVQVGLAPLTIRVWSKMWSDAITPPGGEANTVDLGICRYDNSIFNWPGPQNPQPFQWTNGFWYRTYVVIQAFANAGSSAFIEIAKYDDILWIAYTSSPESPWVQSPGSPEISVDPPMGSAGTNAKVSGTGFAPETRIYVYCDDRLMNTTLSDGEGKFTCGIMIDTEIAKGPHAIRAIDALENSACSFFDVFIEKPPIIGDISGPTTGVPDGKTDMRDVFLIAKNFGKTDPNVDPPETTSVGLLLIGASTLASIGAFSIGLSRLRKKKEQLEQT